jgi:hypothetical protein
MRHKNHESILDVQRAIYGADKRGPPMLPHGDDPLAVCPPKRRKRVRERQVDIPCPNPNESTQNEFVASELPAGFASELSFRALAAYSLLRTLSLQLRLSPFTPIAFLRALYLPLPNKLLGRVHVALLRVLLRNLKLGYHWGEKDTPPIDVIKKRKVDGLRWPLRAGDHLQFLDAYTWPVFFDDYCHLTADTLYASMHDRDLYIEDPQIDVSHVHASDTLLQDDSANAKHRRRMTSSLYLHEEERVDDNSDGEWAGADGEESNETDAMIWGLSKRRSRRKDLPCLSHARNAANFSSFVSDLVVEELTVVRTPVFQPSTSIAPCDSQDFRNASDSQALHTPLFSIAGKAEHSSNEVDRSRENVGIASALPPIVHDPCHSSKEDSFIPFTATGPSDSLKRPISALQRMVSENDSPEGEIDVAQVLRRFIQGKGRPNSDMLDDTSSIMSSESNDSSAGGADGFSQDRWSHFRSLRRMRSGTPYHHLLVSEKLDILEFLIDELLTVDSVSAEMTAREGNTARTPVPFAPLPSPHELADIENEDWCAVCRQEGELLCCDGCVASYHRECVGLLKFGDLPGGKWFCPECILVDPASFGPLRGGRKSMIGWSDVTTLHQCYRYCGGTVSVDNECINVLRIAPNSQRGAFGMESQLDQSNRTIPSPEYLCVHGYVFCRMPREKGQESPQLLSPDLLRKHLSILGSAICSAWPLAQIPLDQSRLRDVTVLQASNGSMYTRWPERYNPCLYDNKYQAAPLLSKARRQKEDHTFHFESRFNPVSLNSISDILRKDVGNDDIVKKSLQYSFRLFNPFTMISSYMLDLEAKLRKASLLNHYWVAQSRATVWRERARSCRSLEKLAGLLVTLEDAIHSRAFLEGWLVSTRTKSAPGSTAAAPEQTVRVSENLDLTAISLRRQWKRCPVSSISSLLCRGHENLHDWIRENRPDLATAFRGRKRKRAASAFEAKGCDSGNFTGSMEVRENVVSLPRIYLSPDAPERSSDDEDEGNKISGPPSTKLRSRIRQPYSQEHQDSVKDDASERTQKLTEVVEGLIEPFVPEGRWPLAGRKLFPPAGSLPTPVVRYLGRNAGCELCPFVSYSPGFEVGQSAVCHVWRKAVFECKNFEELLLHIKTMEGHLDNAVSANLCMLSQLFDFDMRISPTI